MDSHSYIFFKKKKLVTTNICSLGLSVTYANAITYPHPLCVASMSTQTVTAFAFLSIGLLASLVTIPMTGFLIRKWYAGVLLLIYLTATAFGLLAEFGVLDFHIGKLINKQ